MRYNKFYCDTFFIIELNKLSQVFYLKYYAIDTFKHNISSKPILNTEKDSHFIILNIWLKLI